MGHKDTNLSYNIGDTGSYIRITSRRSFYETDRVWDINVYDGRGVVNIMSMKEEDVRNIKDLIEAMLKQA